MAELELQDLLARASTLYQADSPLRVMDRRVEDIRFSRHSVRIPETMKNRVVEVKSHIGAEKIDRSKSLLGSTQGMKVKVASNGSGAGAQTEKGRVQQWLTGAFHCAEKRSSNRFSDNIKEQCLLFSRGWVKVLPMPEIYGDCPLIDDDADDETRKQQKSRAENYRRKNFPVLMEWVSSQGVYSIRDHLGLSEVIDIQEWPVQRVLDSFKDKDGRPLAQNLASNASRMNQYRHELTNDDVCTIIVRADRKHMQIAVADFLLDHGTTSYRTRYGNEGEMIWSGPHGLRRVPYVHIRGRETASENPVEKFWGLLHPCIDLIPALDNALTQQGSSVETTAWPGMVIEKHIEATGVGAEDRPQAIVLDEGSVYDGLAPGERITSPAWTNAENYRIMPDYINWLLGQIDKHTLSAASYGTGNAPSGYLNAQEQAASEHVLEPFEIGLNRGFAEVSELVLECARYLIEECDFPPIPVLYTTDDGSEYVTLDEKLVSQEWEIECDINSKPAGGEMAKAQFLATLKQNGWADDTLAIEQLGMDDPQRIFERRAIDQFRNGSAFAQMVDQGVMQRVTVALANAVAPAIPPNPMVPGALAAAMPAGTTAQAMLPDMGFGSTMPGAMPSLGGTGNPLVPAVASGAPTPRPGVEGMAQGMPGGANRMSELIGRQG